MRFALGRIVPRHPHRGFVALSLAAGGLLWTIHLAVANTSGHFLKFGDYQFQGQPAVDALARGDVAGFVHVNSLMGPVSAVLRAPMLILARAVGGGEALGYTLGSLACLLPLAGLAAWVVVETGRLRRPLYVRAAIVALFVLCPFVPAAFQWGHPEDLLAIALCLGAVLLATRGRVVLAAVALGLAIATKQWALVAIAPVLLAMPRHRLRVATIGGALVAAATVPIILVDPPAFVAAVRSIASAQSWVSATNVWWPLAHAHTFTVFDGVANAHVIKYTLPASVNWIPHALIVLIGLPLGALIAARRRPVTLDQALSLLALLFFLRCALDPWDNAYYQVAPLVALYARDALCARGLPLASAFATVATAITFNHIAIVHGGLGRFAFSNGSGLTNLVYLAYTLPLVLWLAANALQLRVPGFLTAPLPRAWPRRAAAANPAQAA